MSLAEQPQPPGDPLVPRQDLPEQLTVRETLSRLTVDELKALLALVRGPVQARKAELVEQLAAVLESPREVRALYEGLDDLARKTVQEATHDPLGVWHQKRFAAKYGGLPDLGTGGRYQHQQKPAELRLFFPRDPVLATDLRATLRAFVPEPPPLAVSGVDELPARARRPHLDLGPYHRKPDPEEVELRVRETSRAALLDVKAVLRLVDAGVVKVGEKTRRPSQASLKAVAGVLSEGDFYADADRCEWSHDPASDLAMRAFAWPMLLQAAGLAGAAGAKLQLTPAGRKAVARPAHEAIRQIWSRWLKTTLLDEMNRVEVIKGQQSRGSLTAVAPRPRPTCCCWSGSRSGGRTPCGTCRGIGSWRRWSRG
jgi:hypothetical protein